MLVSVSLSICLYFTMRVFVRESAVGAGARAATIRRGRGEGGLRDCNSASCAFWYVCDIHKYVHMHIYTYTWMVTYTYVCIYMYVYLYVHICICVCLNMCKYMYLCVYVYMYVCILYMYAYTDR